MMELKRRNTLVILNQPVSEYFLFLHTRNKLIKQVILAKILDYYSDYMGECTVVYI